MTSDIFRELGLDFQKNAQLLKLHCEEQLIFDVTELISMLMSKKGLKKSDLANRLNISKSAVTHCLDGSTNMTLRTVADILLVLDAKMTVNAEPLVVNGNINGAFTTVWFQRESTSGQNDTSEKPYSIRMAG
ncbi:MAG: helix-turn-helix transcriptional regulator [Sedimentisphaerales bacterium]